MKISHIILGDDTTLRISSLVHNFMLLFSQQFVRKSIFDTMNLPGDIFGQKSLDNFRSKRLKICHRYQVRFQENTV